LLRRLASAIIKLFQRTAHVKGEVRSCMACGGAASEKLHDGNHGQ